MLVVKGLYIFDQRHLGLCHGYVITLTYSSCRVSDQGTTHFWFLEVWNYFNQAIIWTGAGISLIEPFVTNYVGVTVWKHSPSMLCKDGRYQLQAANELAVLYSLWHALPRILSLNKANICEGYFTDTSNLNPDSLKIVWMVHCNIISV